MRATELSEADLQAVVGVSSSWREVLRRCGETSPRIGRRLRERCDELGISYRHFRSGGGRCADVEALRTAIGSSTTWREVMHALGYRTESGTARATLRKQAQASSIDIGHLDGSPARDGAAFTGSGEAKHLRRAAPLLVAARCALLGHDVSWPLEPKPYDLLVDTAQEGLLRVQVKSGTRFTEGSWIVWITKSERGQRLAYRDDEIDYFGVVSGDHAVYMLPVQAVEGQSSLCLRAYEQYRLAP